MKITYADYVWILVGIPKTNVSKQTVTFFSGIEDFVIAPIIEELDKYHIVLNPESKSSKEYQNAKKELKQKLQLTQQQELITITAISRLTKIAEKKLLRFLAGDADFNTGELFALSMTLNQILICDQPRDNAS